MSRPRPRRRTHPLLAAMYLSVIAAAWLLLAPTAFGGQASYVVINGSSMEPGMRRGDLAILRQREHYAVGEVVTYRHPEIGPVIHRVIGRAGPRFIFKGDNNTFIDPYRPHQEELLGQVWLFIPRAGALLIFLRQPPVFAGLAALLIGTATMTTGSLPLRQRRRSDPAQARSHDRAAMLNAALTFTLALGLISMGMAALAFSQPTTRAAERTLTYAQRSTFDYSAPAPAEIYDGGVARGGDPIFRKLADSVAVTTTYTLASDAPAELAGTAQLRLVIGDGAGWRRTVDLGPETPFRGPSVALAGTLDLPAIEAALRSYEARTGIRQSSYQLALAPIYHVRGTLGGAPITASYSPSLSFVLDETRLRPLVERPDQALAGEEAGALTATEERPATLALWMLRLDVLATRRLALAGLEVALVIGLLAGWQLSRELRRDPVAAARLRFGAQLVRAPAGAPWACDAVALSSLEDLARLAQHGGQPIIQIEAGAEAGFYVRDGATVYSYRQAPCRHPEGL